MRLTFTLLGERERAHLVVQLAHVWYIYTTMCLTVNSCPFSHFAFRTHAQSLTTCSPLAAYFVSESTYACSVTMFCQAHFRPCWQDVVSCNDNVPAIITPGRVLSKGRSTCLGVVALSNNVVGTDSCLSRRGKRGASVQALCRSTTTWKGSKS